MAGVEMLATNEIVVRWEFNWTMWWIIFGGCVGIFLLIGVALSLYNNDPAFMAFVFIGAIAGAMMGMLLGAYTGDPAECELQYKVTISDEVIMSEFFEKYEVIETEGKIYTVKER